MAACISSDLLKQFTDLIPKLPTIAELTQPVADCTPDIANLLKLGTAFANPLDGAFDCTNIQLQGLIDGLNTLSGLSDPEAASVGSAVTILGEATSQVFGFSEHTNALVAGMPRNMGTVLGSIRSKASLGSSLPINPCKALDDVMGSVLGAGAALLNAIGEAIAPLVAAILGPIAALVGAIASVLAPIANAIADIANQISKEVAALNEVLQEVENFSLANAIPGLANDPCLQAIFNAVGTPDLLSCLDSHLPNFKIF